MSDLRPERTIFDFLQPETVRAWTSIDDRIMGGGSISRPTHMDGVGMRFHGTVSLDNNGGFASIRSASAPQRLDSYRGLRLRLRGDGQSYKLSLRTDHYFDGVSYQAGFKTEKNVWQELVLPFNNFVATHHGLRLCTVAELQPDQVQSFGLFIADSQSGPFHLDLAWIKGWLDD